MSERYRGETLDGTLHISGDLAANAYLVTRLPATYAAVRDAMAKLAELRGDAIEDRSATTSRTAEGGT